MPFVVNAVEMSARMMPSTEIYQASKPFLGRLMSPNYAIRMSAIRDFDQTVRSGDFPALPTRPAMGNHYHDNYSWGPGYPALAAFFSKVNGLVVTGQVNHYSLAGAGEFRQACGSLLLPCTVGFEVRALERHPVYVRDNSGSSIDLSKTVINSPGNPGEIYEMFHGVVGDSSRFIEMAHRPKLARYQGVVGLINDSLASHNAGFYIPYGEVVSTANEANVLDRHVTDALFNYLFDDAKGDFNGIASRMSDWWGPLTVAEADKLAATSTSDEYAASMVLRNGLRDRLLKTGMPAYIQPSYEECPGADALNPYAVEDNAWLTLAFLKPELAFLDDYMEVSGQRGFTAISAMQNRNPMSEIDIVKEHANIFEFLYINGMDVNNWTQTWIDDPHSYDPYLIATTFMLVGHEAALRSGFDGMHQLKGRYNFADMCRILERIGRESDPSTGKISPEQYAQTLKLD